MHSPLAEPQLGIIERGEADPKAEQKAWIWTDPDFISVPAWWLIWPREKKDREGRGDIASATI